MDLVLFTQFFPFSKVVEYGFLKQEMPFLSKSFDRVVIVPQNITGEKVNIGFENIEINTGLYTHLQELKFNKKHRPAFLLELIRFINYYFIEIILNPTLLFNFRKRRRIRSHYLESIMIYSWLKKFIVDEEINISKTIFYTYWFDKQTNALVFLKKKIPELNIVTRAHGYDLFEERHLFNYIPFRANLIKKIDLIFPCMQAGTAYLLKKYRLPVHKIKTSYLGVDDQNELNKPSQDLIFRVVSCSSIIALKRLHLIIQGLKELSAILSDKKIEWIHFGDGDLRSEIENTACNTLADNVTAIFKGQVELNQIIGHYKNYPVDVFINVSSTEGQPVTIKEAISFGIPIIATNVGGNAEIVNGQNGILLSSNPTPKEIANALKHFIQNDIGVSEMRKQSRKLFLQEYDSKKVYPEFINHLMELPG